MSNSPKQFLLDLLSLIPIIFPNMGRINGMHKTSGGDRMLIIMVKSARI